MDYIDFYVDVPGYSPAIFCRSARSPIRRRFLVSWRRAPHPRRTLRALTSVALCIPRKIASSSWVIWGLKSSLSPVSYTHLDNAETLARMGRERGVPVLAEIPYQTGFANNAENVWSSLAALVGPAVEALHPRCV